MPELYMVNNQQILWESAPREGGGGGGLPCERDVDDYQKGDHSGHAWLKLYLTTKRYHSKTYTHTNKGYSDFNDDKDIVIK